MKRMSVVVAGVLVGCASVPDVGRGPRPGISGSVWALRALQGTRVTDRRIATLRLGSDHRVTGTSACNDVGPGKLQWTGETGDARGTINAEGTGSSIITAVGCGDKLAVERADRFWRLMGSAQTWSLDRGRLSITFADKSRAYLVPVKQEGRTGRF